ncbi:MAG TPA: hypothetical protein VF735_03245 [Pyrinomonadaceae bacterium]|jgi:hypothetical protein
MALNDEEIVTVAEICGKQYEEVEFNQRSRTAAQYASLRADIEEWNSIRNKHLKPEGVDLGFDRRRAAITERVSRMLFFDEEGSGGIGIRLLRG